MKNFLYAGAAEFSNVSIQQMARYLTQRGISFFKQSIEESEKDVIEAKTWL